MDLASTRVFGITELTVLIISFLDKKDISRLLQTSPGFHDIFSSSFYNEIDLIKDDRRLAVSPDAMLALSRNAKWIIEHWPILREAGFCLPNTETCAQVRSCLASLQDQLPRLTIPDFDFSP
ncbi:hypothetical protein BGZ89_012152 [Linnemannia elongata]|nr:hypothetical protein BGZ89_012152 [Linnemannia elongata]